MQLSVREENQFHVVTTEEAVLSNKHQVKLKGYLSNLIDEGFLNIILDFANVKSIDSSILGVLMLAHNRVRKQDGTFQLITTQPQILFVLEATNLNRILPVRDSLEVAIEWGKEKLK